MGAQGSQALFGNGANQLVPGGGAVGGRQTITPQFQAEQKQQLRDQLPDRKKNPRGMNSTATTNSRTVRPREMRAMNMPTKGDHEIHHAQ